MREILDLLGLPPEGMGSLWFAKGTPPLSN